MTAARTCRFVLAAFLVWLPACASALPPREADIVAVVTAFYGAITAGDDVAAMRLIASDAVFMESGKLETRDEYQKNHLPADIEFERRVKGTRSPLRVTFQGSDAAWVVSRTEYDEGNPEKYIITQLMVLTRDDAANWRIRTISWSTNQP